MENEGRLGLTESPHAAMRRRAWRFRFGASAAVVAVSGALVASWVLSGKRLPDDLVACLAEAQTARAAHDIERERRILNHAESLDGEPNDVAEVQRRLAVLDWKFHARFAAARDRLLAATAGAKPAEAWLALARLEQARESYAAAGEAARQARETAETEGERRRAIIAAAKAAVAEAVAARRQGEPADSAPVRDVFADLHDLVRQDSGGLEPSRLLLKAALILDRGDAALAAWRSYFHAAPGQPLVNAVAGAGVELTRLLPTWEGPNAAPAERTAFAPEPRLALSGIFSATIGDPSPHGQANLEVMKGLVAWMQNHRQEIVGLDSGRPWLPQFDLLSDEQIRAAFRSMDPLAKGVGLSRSQRVLEGSTGFPRRGAEACYSRRNDALGG